MEKLGQLRARDEWDLIIVDTPPSRSALDFLDAPKRLGSFLDGKFIRLLMAPAKVGGRAGMKFLNVGMSMMTGTLGKLLGGQFLRDVQTFVAAMDTMFGGFRSRADATYKLLQAPVRPSSWSRPRAGRTARGRVLRGAAGGRGHAAGRSRPEPGARQRGRPALRRAGADRRRKS